MRGALCLERDMKMYYTNVLFDFTNILIMQCTTANFCSTLYSGFINILVMQYTANFAVHLGMAAATMMFLNLLFVNQACKN